MVGAKIFADFSPMLSPRAMVDFPLWTAVKPFLLEGEDGAGGGGGGVYTVPRT